MKLDMHTHCLPASLCARHEPETLPDIFQSCGIDAIVLTNHCYPTHCKNLGDTLEKQANAYVDTYRRCKAKGDSIGVKVFFGVEIKLINEPHRPEFLLYGISEEDFMSSYPLYEKTQKQLFDFCEQKNIIMVQAHPFRAEQGYAPADMRYVHGIEVYNPHPRFETRYEDALKLALDHSKILTSGSDFHLKDRAGLAGMIVPDFINDQFALRDFLREKKSVIFDKNGVIYRE